MFGIETKPFGVIMGLLGNVMTGLAIYKLLSMDFGEFDTSAVWLLPAGIVISTMAIFFGGGGLVFATSFLAIGIGAIASGTSFGYLFGGIFALSSLFPAFMAFSFRGKQEQAMNLVATGVKATGTLVSITDTGMTINDNPRVQLVMRIQPDDGSPAFDATKAVTVSRVAVPRVGDRFPVWYDRANPTKWAYGASTPAPL